MTEPEQGPDKLEHTIARKAEHRVRARREGRHTVWFGVGMFGLVGWAVAVPTLLGVAVGRWLDARFADGPSWTMMGLLAGVALGSANAWWWVRRTGAWRGDGREGNDKEDRR
ncbi:AtpZ/AtpI family protein [Acidimangrovimonas pyrenivorans]|uniref:AtpZ/AtpI family protein n=1 Tax=Acidimangrovimonas pyrenivorans TaxID=2030798 RepID=A0ABV7AGR9_9RHOB